MEKAGRIAELLSLVLVAVAFIAIQILIGGTRMVFSLPSYGVLGVVGILAIFSLGRTKPPPSARCLGVAAIFFAYILVRAAFSPVPYIARSDFYSVLAGLIIYFYTACILTDAKQRTLLIATLLALALGHAFVGAIQFRNGDNFMPISWLRRVDYEWRASGFYICPNHLAGLVEVLGVLGLSIVCWSRWRTWVKLLVAYTVVICYVALVLTASRGGYLSAGVSLIVFAILSLSVVRQKRGSLFAKALGIGLVVAILLGVSVTFAVKSSHFLSHRAQNTFDVNNMRLDLWKGALRQWALSPVVGTGSATYLYYGRLFRTDRVQEDPIYTHNDYLQLLAEYGLVGAAGMLLFLGVHLTCGLRNFARLGPRRVALSQLLPSNALALNIGALAAVGSYLAHSVVDFNLHIPGNVLLMAFVFGLVANDGVVREREVAAETPNKWLWRIILPALGGMLLVECIRLFPGEYFSERARVAVRDQHAARGMMYALRGLKHDPENPDLYYHLGRAQMILGEQMDVPLAADSFYREGIAALQRAREIAPRDEIYGLELAAALDTAQRFDDAEIIFQETMELDPRSLSLRRYYNYHLKQWENEGAPQKAVAKQES